MRLSSCSQYPSGKGFNLYGSTFVSQPGHLIWLALQTGLWFARQIAESYLNECGKTPTTWPTCSSCGASLQFKGALLVFQGGEFRQEDVSRTEYTFQAMLVSKAKSLA